MKSKKFDLQSSIVTTYGDTTKTFRTTNITQKTVNLKTCLGPPRTFVLPVFDDFGVSPNSIFIGKNRIFVFAAIAAGLSRVCLYDFDVLAGSVTPIGSLNMAFPSGTHTIRSVAVDDGATSANITSWRLFVETTNATTAANGGPFCAGSSTTPIEKSNFTVVPTTIPTATLADAKQVYKLENSPFTLTACVGLVLQRSSTNLYAFNGTATTLTAAKFNYSLATGVPGANGAITTWTVFGGTGVTGTLPSLTGTILQADTFHFAQPISAPNPAAVLGFDCAYFMTSTRTYLGRLDELVAGGTTWASLSEANNVIAFTHINPTYVFGCWDNTCDRLFGGLSSSNYVMKANANNVYDKWLGASSNRFFESGSYLLYPSVNLGLLTPTRLASGLGWLGICTTTASQRVAILMPAFCDEFFGNEYLITKVLDTKSALKFEFASTIAQLREYRSDWRLQYRTSGFASQTVGWIDVPSNYDMSALAVGEQIQFRLLPRVFSEWYSEAEHIEDVAISYTPRSELSDNWVGSVDNTATGTPSRSAFRLITAYTVSVPKLYFRAYDDAGSLVASANTVDNPTSFEYSTTNGTSWTPLGTIPNVALTTELRYNFSSPPGVRVVVSLSES